LPIALEILSSIAVVRIWPAPTRWQGYLAMRGRRIIQRDGHAAGSCGNEPHGDRPGGFFLRRRREAGFRRCPSTPSGIPILDLIKD
jgi:hypothetical protein